MNKPESQRTDTADALTDIAQQIQSISRENKRLFRRLLDSEHRFRGLARSVWRVQEEERRRLARELHDSIGQILVGLIHQVERLSRRLDSGDNQSLVDDIHGLARQALDETRELSRLLRPPVLDDLGLEAALSWLVRTLAERTGIQAVLQSDLGNERHSPEVETLVFRVVQEALNNSIKHASGASVRIRIARSDARLSVEVIDDGPGFEASELHDRSGHPEGSGLRGIRDRVELFGGSCQFDSRPGEGVRIGIVVPLRQEGLLAAERTQSPS